MKKIIMTMVLAIGILFGASVQDATPVSAMTQVNNWYSYDESSIYVTANNDNEFTFNVVTYIRDRQFVSTVSWYGNDWNHVYISYSTSDNTDKFTTGSDSPAIGMFREVWYSVKGYSFS